MAIVPEGLCTIIQANKAVFAHHSGDIVLLDRAGECCGMWMLNNLAHGCFST
jgi:hypothetical protein